MAKARARFQFSTFIIFCSITALFLVAVSTWPVDHHSDTQAQNTEWSSPDEEDPSTLTEEDLRYTEDDLGADEPAEESTSTMAGWRRPSPKPEATTAYELTEEDQIEILALENAWEKQSLATRSNVCDLYTSDLDSAVDPLTEDGTFDEHVVVSFLTIKCI